MPGERGAHSSKGNVSGNAAAHGRGRAVCGWVVYETGGQVRDLAAHGLRGETSGGATPAGKCHGAPCMERESKLMAGPHEPRS